MSTLTIKRLVEDKAPVQVMFYDGENMCAGIMLGEYVICGCCGALFEVENIVEMARADGEDAIRLFDTWVDLSDEIRGDDAATAVTVENGGYV